MANRARILAAASAAFDREGVEVSLDEIARRAGVGAGTVHRHFPTKAALLDAVVVDGVSALAAEATALARASDPAGAFCGFLARMIERGASSHALAHRLKELGVDVGPSVAAPVRELRAALGALLRRAQRAGGIRRDLDPDTLDAIIAGGHAIQIHPHGGERMVALLCDALRS